MPTNKHYQDIPAAVIVAFESVTGFINEYYPNKIICMENSDIEIYTTTFSHDFNYYQATTYLNTNYDISPTLTVTKL